jgi:hypothetical protein
MLQRRGGSDLMQAMKNILRTLFGTTVMVVCVSCASWDDFGKPKYKISVHVQGDQNDMPRDIIKFPINGRELAFKRVPEFTQSDISAFEPFDSPDGANAGQGVVLQLDFHGKNALQTLTNTHQGEYVLSVVNGVPVDLVQTDKPIGDGRFTIWRGLSPETIQQMEKKLPRIRKMRSASQMMDMQASTDSEKKTNREAILREEKYQKEAEKRRARAGELTPAPRSKEIPLE